MGERLLSSELRPRLPSSFILFSYLAFSIEVVAALFGLFPPTIRSDFRWLAFPLASFMADIYSHG